MVLPSSYNVSGDLTTVGDHPVANGGFADVWEGTHGGKKVCIKCPRVSVKDFQAVTEVRIRCKRAFFVFAYKDTPVAVQVIPQGGHLVEKVKTP